MTRHILAIAAFTNHPITLREMNLHMPTFAPQDPKHPDMIVGFSAYLLQPARYCGLVPLVHGASPSFTRKKCALSPKAREKELP